MARTQEKLELTEAQFAALMVGLDERFQRDKVYGDALREIHFLLASLERPPLAAQRAMDLIEQVGLDPRATLPEGQTTLKDDTK